jgi:hypothetical protein
MELEPGWSGTASLMKGSGDDKMAYSASIASFDFMAKKSFVELPIPILELGDFLFFLETDQESSPSTPNQPQRTAPLRERRGNKVEMKK